ncbi:MAG: VCBS repeat-containing protein [Planctomycetaceae bacterium]
MDVVATAWNGVGQLVWYENQGDPRGKWVQHILKDKWRRANQVLVVDLNRDSKPDIIAGAERGSNEVRWWKNLGATTR